MLNRSPLSAPPRPAAPSRPASVTAAASSADEFTAFCEGVRRLCGIDLVQYKRGQMERRVRTFVERKGSASLAEHLKVMQADVTELDAFLDRVTINVSQLWRNPEQWERLEKKVLPELGERGTVRAWSAGCSYGAEAFTLAAIAKLAGVRISVTGTDIDKRVVERARRGRFSADDARDAPSASLTKCFDPQPDGGWVGKADLHRSVKFEVGDLLRLPVRPASYDLVLCRNTVIYFTDDVRDALHARLVESLRPGGYLVVGATERVADQSALGLVPAFPFTYRKSDR